MTTLILETVHQAPIKTVTLTNGQIQIKNPLLPLVQVHNIENYFDGRVQDCSNSIADAPELLQSCTKP